MKDLSQSLRDVPRGTSRQSLSPRGELGDVQTIETNVTEGGGRVAQSRSQRRERVLLGDVLREELGNELGQFRHRLAANNGNLAVSERSDVLRLVVDPLTGVAPPAEPAPVTANAVLFVPTATATARAASTRGWRT